MLKCKIKTATTVIIFSIFFFTITNAQTTIPYSQIPNFHSLKPNKTTMRQWLANFQNITDKVWEVPFASVGNKISLNVQNNSNTETKNVSVTFYNLPSWLKFKSNAVLIKSISAHSSKNAEFEFTVDEKAPAENDTTLLAIIKTSNGQKRMREIRISVAAPKSYKLYNNFPNPFNPSTKIAFLLPKTTHVKLIIYDIMGREIEKIADGKYPQGYNEVTWNGNNSFGVHVSSGIYFYRISAGAWSKVRKMMLLK